MACYQDIVITCIVGLNNGRQAMENIALARLRLPGLVMGELHGLAGMHDR